jgi:GTP-binding protein EngB required for normal cell division
MHFGQNDSIPKNAPPEDINLTVALAGNANVGKSALFNQLTGVDQIIGNWPGKTVERAEGTLQFKGSKFKVIDLQSTPSLPILWKSWFPEIISLWKSRT